MRLAFFVFWVGWMTASVTLTAQDLPLSKFGIDTTATVPEGLPVGMYAPLFAGQDADGNQIALSEFLKQSTAVVVFVQGMWSRHDRNFLKTLNDSLASVAIAAAQVIVITSEKPNVLSTMRERYPSFKIISDTDGSMGANYDVQYTVTKAHARRYNLFNRAKLSSNQVAPEKLPVPAVYIVASSGKVRYRFFSYDRRQRPSVAELADVANGILHERR
jgi:peroxiredoxin